MLCRASRLPRAHSRKSGDPKVGSSKPLASARVDDTVYARDAYQPRANGRSGARLTVSCLLIERRSDRFEITGPNSNDLLASTPETRPVAGTMLVTSANTGRPSLLKVNRGLFAKFRSTQPG